MIPKNGINTLPKELEQFLCKTDLIAWLRNHIFWCNQSASRLFFEHFELTWDPKLRIRSAKKFTTLVKSSNENPSNNPVYPPISANNVDCGYARWLSRTGIEALKYMVRDLSPDSYMDGYPNDISIWSHARWHPSTVSPSKNSPVDVRNIW